MGLQEINDNLNAAKPHYREGMGHAETGSGYASEVGQFLGVLVMGLKELVEANPMATVGDAIGNLMWARGAYGAGHANLEEARGALDDTDSSLYDASRNSKMIVESFEGSSMLPNELSKLNDDVRRIAQILPGLLALTNENYQRAQRISTYFETSKAQATSVIDGISDFQNQNELPPE